MKISLEGFLGEPIGHVCTFKEATSLPQAARWKVAADKEIANLKKHGVYELVPASSVPAGQKVVGSRWVNKIKADDFFKSRLIVLKWAQVPRIDCGGTFTPVCSLQSIRMMLAIAPGSTTRCSCWTCKQRSSTLT